MDPGFLGPLRGFVKEAFIMRLIEWEVAEDGYEEQIIGNVQKLWHHDIWTNSICKGGRWFQNDSTV